LSGIRGLFRLDAPLAAARLKPSRGLQPDQPMAAVWNRIGGLLLPLCAKAGIEPAAALAVWMVECGGLPFRRGKPVLRFEAHVFFNQWGKDNEAIFDRHFQFGGRNGIDGARWQQHKFRLREGDGWRIFHGSQEAEYRALRLATRLAGRELACRSASFGGPQIMGFNHDAVGYDSAAEMRDSFARSERWQVCAFFDFCAAKDLLTALRQQDWLGFASVYNGPGNAANYGEKIGNAYCDALLCLGERV